MPRFLSAALRRIRLLTAFALVGVPWLIVRSDLSWRDGLVAAAAFLGIALLIGISWSIVARRARNRRRT